jgi:putative endonuclease
MTKLLYMYILQSDLDPTAILYGFHRRPVKRLRADNAGRVGHTGKWKSWRLKTKVAFSDRIRAVKFERYLSHLAGAHSSKAVEESSAALNSKAGLSI